MLLSEGLVEVEIQIRPQFDGTSDDCSLHIRRRTSAAREGTGGTGRIDKADERRADAKIQLRIRSASIVDEIPGNSLICDAVATQIRRPRDIKPKAGRGQNHNLAVSR